MPIAYCRIVCHCFLLAAGCLWPGSKLLAADAYYEAPLNEQTIIEGTLLAPDSPGSARRRMISAMQPRVVLDEAGEGYLKSEASGPDWLRFDPGRGQRAAWTTDSLIVHAPEGREVTGSLYLPKPDWSGMVKLRFRIPADSTDDKARETFHRAKQRHYRRLVQQGLPGSAWFRYQENLLRAELDGKDPAETVESPENVNRRPERSQWEDTFQVFSGGRAVSENLQLDRLLPTTPNGEPSVDIDTIEGITVAEMDWETLNKGIDPETDPQAAYVPADQHALFFRSFDDLVTLVDEARLHGTPILDLMQPGAQDAQSQQRYEKQLCLELDRVARALGRQVVGSVCLTGSDPYFRTGTDVMLLFETKSPNVVTAYVTARHQSAAKSTPDCQLVQGTVGELDYTGAVSADRSICSYMAEFGDVVAVTNSLAQLERLVDVKSGESPSLGSLPEYRFFRDRYRRGSSEETAFLIVTDATIRRWCGPKWRIATSRRTRAAAVMAEHVAQHLDALVDGSAKPDLLHTDYRVADLGSLRLTETGVVSSTYGSLDFLTPIAELEISRVTETEARTYENWRRGYQRYWRQFFDPIAVRIHVEESRLFADVTVMPLIASSDYQEYIAISSGATIEPDAGDRHVGTLLHWAMSINPESRMARQADSMLQSLAATLETSALSWLGGSIAVYAEESSFWKELGEADQQFTFLLREIHRLPVVLRAEVEDSLKLALFLTGVRGTMEQTAPGLTVWETLKHNEQPYVKIAPANDSVTGSIGLSEQFAIYYAPTPRSLIVTLNEDLLKQALDRQAARVKAEKENKPPAEYGKPWLGTNLALQADSRVLELFEGLYQENYQALMQTRAWSAIPILNEWKHRYPKQEPVALHERYWQLKPRCPGGGDYVWNDELQTMESTVYGSPVRPQEGPKSPLPLKQIRGLNLGVSFENDGLRAKAAVERDAGNP